MTDKKHFDLPIGQSYKVVKACNTETEFSKKHNDKIVWLWDFRTGSYMCSICGEHDKAEQ
jgi:hypothetical protein